MRKNQKLYFFFDEAHLLFNDCLKILLQNFEQIIKLIRSKGVPIFFITQNPQDIPESILGQLGNKIQHTLRAFTPKENKAIHLVAETFRANPKFEIAEVITQLKTGEALVSVLQKDGTPSVTQRAMIAPPHSKIGTIDEAKLKHLVEESPLLYKYKNSIDRESAYEVLTKQLNEKQEIMAKEAEAKRIAKEEKAMRKNQTPAQATVNHLGKVLVDSITRSVGREITRGIFGSIKKLF